MKIIKYKFGSLLLMFFFNWYFSKCEAQELPLKRMDYEVYDTETGKSTKLHANIDVILSTKKITVKPGERIESIIAAEKINPNDKDIFSVLYYINPNVNQLDSLKEGTILLIPNIKFLKMPLEANQFLLVKLDDEIKRSITTKSSILQDSLTNNHSIKREVLMKKIFGNLEIYGRYKQSIILLNQICITIAERTAIITLDQLTDLDIASSFLIKLIQKQVVLSNEEISRLLLLLSELKVWASYFIEKKANGSVPKDDRIEIVLTLKKDAIGTDIRDGYRIFYCSPALFPDGAHVLGEVGRIISYKISPANWIFWAKKAPVSDNFPPDTEKIELFIDNDHKKVDLFLKK